MVADLEQADKNRRVRIPQQNAQREGDDLAQIGDNTKNRRWTIKIYWRRSGSENANLDKVPSKFEEKFKKTFLENQTGFLPTNKARSHCTSTQSIQRSSPKLLRNIFGKFCHELLQQADLRRLLHVKQVAFMISGLSTTSSLSSLCTPTPPTSSTQDVKGSIPDPASIECESEDRQVRGDPVL